MPHYTRYHSDDFLVSTVGASFLQAAKPRWKRMRFMTSEMTA